MRDKKKDLEGSGFCVECTGSIHASRSERRVCKKAEAGAWRKEAGTAWKAESEMDKQHFPEAL